MKNTLVLLATLYAILLTSCMQNSKPEKKSFFENFKQKNITVINRINHPYMFLETLHINSILNDTLISYFVRDRNEIRVIGYGMNATIDTLCLEDFFNDNKIDHFLGYNYVNNDTVFVLANYMTSNKKRLDYAIFLFNMKGEIQKSWDIAKITGINDTYFCVKSYSQNPITFRNTHLFCMVDIHYPPYEAFDVTKVPTEFVLNIQTNEGYFIYAKPDIYGDGNFYGNHAIEYSKTFINDTTICFSFPIDHNLYLYNTKGDLLLKNECKSMYIDEIEPFDKGEPVTYEKLFEGWDCFPYYHQIIYDTKNGLLYRIVYHKQNKINDNGEKNTPLDRSFSIMAIDKNLNILGEYFIPPYHLSPYLPKINNQDGLYLEILGGKENIIRAQYECIDKEVTTK